MISHYQVKYLGRCSCPCTIFPSMELKPKNQAAQSLSAIRWEKYSPAERSEVAKKAAVKRWKNAKPGDGKALTANARAKLAEKRQKK